MATMPAVQSKPPMTVSKEVYDYASKYGIEATLQHQEATRSRSRASRTPTRGA